MILFWWSWDCKNEYTDMTSCVYITTSRAKVTEIRETEDGFNQQL